MAWHLHPIRPCGGRAVFYVGTIMLYTMAWFLRLHGNLRNPPVRQDALTLLSPLHLGILKTRLSRSGLTLRSYPRPPRLILHFKRARAIREVRTRIKDENPSHTLVGPLRSALACMISSSRGMIMTMTAFALGLSCGSADDRASFLALPNPQSDLQRRVSFFKGWFGSRS